MQRQALYDLARENLRKSYGLGPEELQQIMQVSIKSLRESLEAAQLALDRSNLMDLLTAVHKMNGTLLSLGLTAEAEPAKQIELDLRTNIDRDYHSAFDDLKQNLQPLLSAGKHG